MNLYFIVDYEINNRQRERWGINFFSSKNIQIHIYDISKLIFDKRSSYLSDKKDFITNKFSSYKEFELKISTITESSIIIAANIINNENICKIVTEKIDNSNKIFWLFLSPTIENTFINFNNFIYGIIKKINFYKENNYLLVIKDFIRSIKRLVYLNSIRTTNTELQSNYYKVIGGNRLGTNRFIFHPNNVLYSHSLDWEEVKNVNIKNDPTKMGKYALWIDAAIGHHLDRNLFNEKPFNDLNLYYKNLNTRLREISNIFHLKIIIQSHPNSIGDIAKFFDSNFEIRQDNLIKNIAGSDLVITHSSDSLGIAAAYKKDVILFTSKRYLLDYDSIFEKYYKLDVNLLNLDNKIQNQISFKPINHNNYQSYVDNYVIHPLDEQKGIWKQIHEKAF